jgi:glycosyltransferase involved in cell wall biosynthesis
LKIAILGNQARTLAGFWRVLIAHMREGGHEVVCLAPPGHEDSRRTLEALGARVLAYPLDRKGINPLRDTATFAALLRLLREERPDICYATTIKPVIYGCLAARMAGVPGVYAGITGLGYAFERDTPLKRAVHRLGTVLYRMALDRAQGVFFQNRDDEAVFRDAHILAPTTRVFIARGTGVDTERFAPCPLPPPPVVFLLVARLLEAKGLREYAEAALSLKEKHPDVRFRLLGPPEEGLGSVPLEQVRRWEAQGALEYLGQADDVRPHVARAHVIVLPSWREGTPTAVMEGMSMGRPAIVTDVPGCREVVRHMENGLLVPLGDVSALARAMDDMIGHPDRIPVMGAAGRRLAVDVFDAHRVASGMLRDMGIPQGESDTDTRQPSEPR